jgi:hypothetical protein
VSTDQPETAASATIGALGYRARCAKAGCRNLGRIGLRYADSGGRPFRNLVLCHAHARVRLARDRAAGLKVYEDRASGKSALFALSARQFSSVNDKKAAVLECHRSAANRHGTLILNDNLAGLTALDAHTLNNCFRHFSGPMFGNDPYCRSNTRGIMST